MGGALPRWRLYALFVLASLATRGPFLGFAILNTDEAAHVVGSWELMREGRLYVDYADHKPPLTYVHYALAQWLLGRGMLAVRLLTALLTLPLTALAASAFFRHDRRGVAAGALYLLYGAAFLAGDMLAVNSEVLMLLPAAWALAVVRDAESAARPSHALASGGLLAMAALFKPQAAFWGLAVAWAVWRGVDPVRARLKGLAAFAGGFVFPLLLTTAWFWRAGTLDEFLYWNVTHNLRYAGSHIEAGAAARRAALYLGTWLLATAPLWWCAWRSRTSLEPYARRLLAGALVASIPAVFLGLRFFPHYFIQLYVPLALLAAPYAAELARRPWTPAARTALAWTAAVAGGFTIANLYLVTRTDVVESRRPVVADVTRRLQADPCFPDARLFIWGFAPELYYASGLRPASRFVVPAYTVSGYDPGNPDARGAEALIRDDHWALLIGDLERNRVTYVLDTAGSGLHRWRPFPVHRFPRLLALLRREFVLLDTVDGVAIYRRTGCDAEAVRSTSWSAPSRGRATFPFAPRCPLR